MALIRKFGITEDTCNSSWLNWKLFLAHLRRVQPSEFTQCHVGIYELLEVTQQIQNAIMEQKDSGRINAITVDQGMQTIIE